MKTCRAGAGGRLAGAGLTETKSGRVCFKLRPAKPAVQKRTWPEVPKQQRLFCARDKHNPRNTKEEQDRSVKCPTWVQNPVMSLDSDLVDIDRSLARLSCNAFSGRIGRALRCTGNVNHIKDEHENRLSAAPRNSQSFAVSCHGTLRSDNMCLTSSSSPRGRCSPTADSQFPQYQQTPQGLHRAKWKQTRL